MGKGIGHTERGGDGWKALGMYVGVGKDRERIQGPERT